MLGRVLVRFSARHSRSGLAPSQRLSGVQVLAIRAYATPGRPKSVVGQPSRPVKRNVKRAAAKPADGTSSAERKVAAKRSSPARKTLTPEQQVAATEKKAQAKIAAQARALKQKEAKQARSLKAKATAKARNERVKVAELKKTALNPPNLLSGNAYLGFSKQYLQKNQLTDSTGGSKREAQMQRIKECGAAWKALSPAEIEVSTPSMGNHTRHIDFCVALEPRYEHCKGDSACRI